MNDSPDEDATLPARTRLREVSAPTELDDLKLEMATMRRGYQSVLQEQQEQTKTINRVEVLATRIHAQLSTMKMTREIAEVGVAGAAVLTSLCLAAFTVRHFGLWVGWW